MRFTTNLQYISRFFWTLCEEDRVKSMVSGLDKKSLVRGMHKPDVFDQKKNPDSEMAKKVTDLISAWMSSRGSNDNWAGTYYIFVYIGNTKKILIYYAS